MPQTCSFRPDSDSLASLLDIKSQRMRLFITVQSLEENLASRHQHSRPCSARGGTSHDCCTHALLNRVSASCRPAEAIAHP